MKRPWHNTGMAAGLVTIDEVGRAPIFRLVGAGRGGGRTPGARDKHAILDQ